MLSIITGIFGMDAQNLASILLNKGHEVVGTYRYSSVPLEKRLEDRPPFYSKIKMVCSDLTDGSGTARLLADYQPDYLFNLAAMSHVGASFNDPLATFNADTIGVLNLLESIRLHSQHSRLYQACHDVQTKALTPDGAKSFTEIKEGDLVVTINEKTKKAEFKKVKKVHIYDYNDDMIKIKSNRVDQLVTPNHKVMIDNKKILADELFNIDKGYFPLCKEKEGDCSLYINFHNFIKNNIKNHYKNLIWKMETADFLYLLGIFIGDGWIKNSWRGIADKNYKQIRNKKGQFISTITTRKYGKITSSYIQIAVPESDPARRKILNILDKYKIKYSCEKININFSSYTLSNMFKMCGDKAYNKYIPNFCWSYDASILQNLLNGLIDSDGYHRGTKAAITTISEKLKSQLLTLSTILGYTTKSSSIKQKNTLLKNGRIIKSKYTAYSISINFYPKARVFKKEYLSKENYSGKVWCLEVEDNSNFLIERNGYVVFSGNSTSEMFGKNFQLKDGVPTQSIHTPFLPSSPYGIAKLAAHHLINIYRAGYGIHAVSGILFNHTDIHRTPTFFERKVSTYVGRLRHWLRSNPIGDLEFTDSQIICHSSTFPKLPLGVIDGVYRDIGWSHDYMRAALLMVESDNPKDYVVATGEAHPISDILEIGLGKNYKNYIFEDPQLVRPVDVPYLKGDSTPIREELGWAPTKSFHELIKLLINNDVKAMTKERI